MATFSRILEWTIETQQDFADLLHIFSVYDIWSKATGPNVHSLWLYVPVQSNKSQCHKLTFMHHENNVHLGVYMIIKLESTEFIFRFCCIPYPLPTNT